MFAVLVAAIFAGCGGPATLYGQAETALAGVDDLHAAPDRARAAADALRRLLGTWPDHPLSVQVRADAPVAGVLPSQIMVAADWPALDGALDDPLNTAVWLTAMSYPRRSRWSRDSAEALGRLRAALLDAGRPLSAWRVAGYTQSTATASAEGAITAIAGGDCAGASRWIARLGAQRHAGPLASMTAAICALGGDLSRADQALEQAHRLARQRSSRVARRGASGDAEHESAARATLAPLLAQLTACARAPVRPPRRLAALQAKRSRPRRPAGPPDDLLHPLEVGASLFDDGPTVRTALVGLRHHAGSNCAGASAALDWLADRPVTRGVTLGGPSAGSLVAALAPVPDEPIAAAARAWRAGPTPATRRALGEAAGRDGVELTMLAAHVGVTAETWAEFHSRIGGYSSRAGFDRARRARAVDVRVLDGRWSTGPEEDVDAKRFLRRSEWQVARCEDVARLFALSAGRNAVVATFAAEAWGSKVGKHRLPPRCRPARGERLALLEIAPAAAIRLVTADEWLDIGPDLVTWMRAHPEGAWRRAIVPASRARNRRTAGPTPALLAVFAAAARRADIEPWAEKIQHQLQEGGRSLTATYAALLEPARADELLVTAVSTPPTDDPIAAPARLGAFFANRAHSITRLVRVHRVLALLDLSPGPALRAALAVGRAVPPPAPRTSPQPVAKAPSVPFFWGRDDRPYSEACDGGAGDSGPCMPPDLLLAPVTGPADVLAVLGEMQVNADPTASLRLLSAMHARLVTASEPVRAAARRILSAIPADTWPTAAWGLFLGLDPTAARFKAAAETLSISRARELGAAFAPAPGPGARVAAQVFADRRIRGPARHLAAGLLLSVSNRDARARRLLQNAPDLELVARALIAQHRGPAGQASRACAGLLRGSFMVERLLAADERWAVAAIYSVDRLPPGTLARARQRFSKARQRLPFRLDPRPETPRDPPDDGEVYCPSARITPADRPASAEVDGAPVTFGAVADRARRRVHARAAARSSEEDALQRVASDPRLAEWMDDPDPKVRAGAIRAIASRGQADKALSEALRARLDDTSDIVAAQAASALAWLDPQATAAELTAWVKAIARSPGVGPPARRALLAALDGPDPEARRAAGQWLAHQATDPLPSALVEWLSGPEAGARDLAAAARLSADGQRVLARAVAGGAAVRARPGRPWTAATLASMEVPVEYRAAAWAHIRAALAEPLAWMPADRSAGRWLAEVDDPAARALAVHGGTLSPTEADAAGGFDRAVLAGLRPLGTVWDAVVIADVADTDRSTALLDAIASRRPPLGRRAIDALVASADGRAVSPIAAALKGSLADCTGAARLIEDWAVDPTDSARQRAVRTLVRTDGSCPPEPAAAATAYSPGSLDAMPTTDGEALGQALGVWTADAVALSRALADTGRLEPQIRAADTPAEQLRLLWSSDARLVRWATLALTGHAPDGARQPTPDDPPPVETLPLDALLQLARWGSPPARWAALRLLTERHETTELHAVVDAAIASPVPMVVNAGLQLLARLDADAAVAARAEFDAERRGWPGWRPGTRQYRPAPRTVAQPAPDAGQWAIERVESSLALLEAHGRRDRRLPLDPRLGVDAARAAFAKRPDLVARALPWLPARFKPRVFEELARRPSADPRVLDAAVALARASDGHHAMRLLWAHRPDALRALADDWQAPVRVSLARLGERLLETHPGLAERLATDPDPAVRAAWFGALVDVRRRPPTPARRDAVARHALTRLTAQPAPEVVAPLLTALAAYGGGRPDVIEALTRPEWAWRADDAIRRQIAAASVESLTEVADVLPSRLRLAALRRLIHHDPSPAGRALAERWIDDPGAGQAARVVAVVMGAPVKPDLLDAVRGLSEPLPGLATWLTEQPATLDEVRLALLLRGGPVPAAPHPLLEAAGARLVPELVDALRAGGERVRPAAAALSKLLQANVDLPEADVIAAALPYAAGADNPAIETLLRTARVADPKLIALWVGRLGGRSRTRGCTAVRALVRVERARALPALASAFPGPPGCGALLGGHLAPVWSVRSVRGPARGPRPFR